jgi:hypothetical protein
MIISLLSMYMAQPAFADEASRTDAKYVRKAC